MPTRHRRWTLGATMIKTTTRLAFLTMLVALATLAEGAAPAAASDDSNWAQWRGPLATGAAPSADPPTTWGEDKNIRWKVKLPGRGSSSPIVWGDSIFVTTAIAKPAAATAAVNPALTPLVDSAQSVFAQVPPPGDRPPGGEGGRRGGPGGPGGRRGGGGGGFGRGEAPTTPHQFVLLCLDRKTGEIRWQKTASEVVPHEGHHPDHGFASHSAVTDGELVFAYFGSRGLHCYDMQGDLKWQKEFGKMQTRNGFGEGSSPALHGDTIVVNWDHQGDDFIVALDKKTGEERWRQKRDEDQTWATPLILEHGGKAQVITVATGKTRSYDLETGKEIWSAPGLTSNTIPSPVSDGEMVFATSGFRGSALYAIKLGGTGDLTDTDSIAWSAKRGTPYVPSPLLYKDRLYFFSGNNAMLSVFDAKTGKPIVETQRIDDLENVYASPVAAAGRVYLVGRNGATVVIKSLDQTNKVEVLASNTLNDRTDASPALVGKELFLRGRDHLYCIAEK